MELSVIIPCLNEDKTIGLCIRDAQEGIRMFNIQGKMTGKILSEIIVADNGSTDKSIEIARALGARIVNVPVRGYGSALRAGIEAANGKYIVMGDSDGSYDFKEIPNFIKKFYEGYEVVLGNRFKGGIEPGAMPFLNKYLGNPALTGLIWILHGTAFGDTQCGLRGGTREAMLALDLKCNQFDFASEMVIKALHSKFRLGEIPVKLCLDDVDRHPHLRRWSDGVLHTKLILKMAFSCFF